MAWLRYKYWRMISEQEQARKFTGATDARTYLVWKKDEGLVDVRNKQDIDRLLLPRVDGGTADFEVAWEKHGVLFDTNGNELDQKSEEFVSAQLAPPTKVLVAYNGEEVVEPKKSRFKSIAERMAYIRSKRKAR